ncbi:ethylene-responsive transcription factor ERF017-like [Cynara cardunculus var. scolymus]|uniref:AP2/ERF domain-containing protein n=1 Tax=Cynara cardunculus var. scolymus TaxID=59895 RepID=A0A103Y286_CYNCS|nr:ethylene-responsive transcription factor ERF017-like [Cynara cardunculus var. scolymus]KVI01161.1 AP2/ERF domain-containing protein [Cynara cardunculus var. scolymus]
MVKSPPPTTLERVDEAKYRGVRKRKWGKWVSEIRLPNSRERIWLGSYDSPEKAARAFDAALFCLRGNTANFNFPHQPPNIPGATDLHPSQIQAVAATYANESSNSPSPDVVINNHNYHLQTPAAASTSNNVNVDEQDSFLMDHVHTNDAVPDFGIFPGFDDYFMPMHPPLLTAHDYYGSEEQVFDSQDSSFQLWNF